MSDTERTYEAKVVSASRELTAREKVMMEGVGTAIKLQDVDRIDNPVLWAIVHIHNEKSESIDYDNYVIATADGTIYKTGSQSFFDRFVDIFDAMEEEGEPFSVGVVRQTSKNNAGNILMARLI